MKRHFFYIFLPVFFLAAPNAGATEKPDFYKGREFWVAFLESEVGKGDFDISLYISAEVKTEVYVKLESVKSGSRGEQSWEATYHVYPNTATVVTIPKEYTLMNDKKSRVTYKGLYVRAEADVLIVAKNSSGASSDATMIIPVQSLGSEYMIMQYSVVDRKYPTQYLVLATEDSTKVELCNTNMSMDGGKAHQKYYVTLNKGEFYMVESDKDLTGSVVKEVKNKKIAVFAGNVCAYVPRYCQSCDHLYEQMPPESSFGFEFAAIPFESRNKYVIRILAKEDNTLVDVNGSRYTIARAGMHVEMELKEAVYIRGLKSVLVAQYTIGAHCDDKKGDPSMVLLKPLLSHTGESSVPGMNTENVKKHYINIVVRTEDADKLLIDGSHGFSTEFDALPTMSEYSYVKLPVEFGQHKIQCDCRYNFTAYGFGWYESYAY